MPTLDTLPTKLMRQVYIRRSTHKKLRVLAAKKDVPMKVLADRVLCAALDSQLAMSAANADGLDFKRQSRNGRKR